MIPSATIAFIAAAVLGPAVLITYLASVEVAWRKWHREHLGRALD